jgi:hypothetical protein
VSDNEAPESPAFRQLEQLVRSLGEELANFRRRAQQAEARVRALEAATPAGDLFSTERVLNLERENAELRARLAFATEKTRAVLDQVRFLRQQRMHGTAPASDR